MMQRDEQLWRYFDLALSRISEGKIMESFSESLKNIKPEVNGLEMLKTGELCFAPIKDEH